MSEYIKNKYINENENENLYKLNDLIKDITDNYKNIYNYYNIINCLHELNLKILEKDNLYYIKGLTDKYNNFNEDINIKYNKLLNDRKPIINKLDPILKLNSDFMKELIPKSAIKATFLAEVAKN